MREFRGNPQQSIITEDKEGKGLKMEGKYNNLKYSKAKCVENLEREYMT